MLYNEFGLILILGVEEGVKGINWRYDIVQLFAAYKFCEPKKSLNLLYNLQVDVYFVRRPLVACLSAR